MPYAFTADAARDLDAIWEYLAERNQAAAQRVLESIYAAAERAAFFPNAGRPGKDVRTREIVLTGYPYIMPYRVEGDTLIILRVFHMAQGR